jgi:hypothetical protein
MKAWRRLALAGVGALKQCGGGFVQEQVTVAMIAEEGGGDMHG